MPSSAGGRRWWRLLYSSPLTEPGTARQPANPQPSTAEMTARQITTSSSGHVLTNAGVWSPDSRWIVYDVRATANGFSFDGTRIERVEIETGRVEVLYESRAGACCGVATCSPVDDRVVFILGPKHPDAEWAYGSTRRRGVVVRAEGSGPAESLGGRVTANDSAGNGASRLQPACFKRLPAKPDTRAVSCRKPEVKSGRLQFKVDRGGAGSHRHGQFTLVVVAGGHDFGSARLVGGGDRDAMCAHHCPGLTGQELKGIARVGVKPRVRPPAAFRWREVDAGVGQWPPVESDGPGHSHDTQAALIAA